VGLGTQQEASRVQLTNVGLRGRQREIEENQPLSIRVEEGTGRELRAGAVKGYKKKNQTPKPG